MAVCPFIFFDNISLTVIESSSPKYKRMMPLILNVKGYSGIRIHSGNTSKDTEGCLLVGLNTKVGMVTDSRNTYQRLFGLMQGEKDISIDIMRKYKV